MKSNPDESKRIESLAQLESVYSQPLESSIKKELTALNEHYRRLIECSPFVSIASAGPEGLDCSPRGDAPGFVTILDDQTLAIPDRRGNNRLDTLRNIVVDPRVGLLFLIPGHNETLRINGRAYLSTDNDLLERFVVGNTQPVSAIVVEIDRIYFQCARAIKRSKLWDASSHIDSTSLPSAGTLIRSAITDFDADTYDAQLQERQSKTLY